MKTNVNNLKVFRNTIEYVRIIKQILHENNVYDCGPGVIEKLLSYIQKHLMEIFEEVKIYMNNDNRTSLDSSDIRLVIDLMRYDQEKVYLSHTELENLALKYNQKPLPEVKQIYGIALPQQGDYCLNKQNFRVKSLRENKYVNMVDVTKHQLFSPLSIHFSNMKSRPFPQQNPYPVSMANSIFRYNSSMPNNFPVMQMHKQKLQFLTQPQKLTVKPKVNIRSNAENVNTLNVDQKKEIIKRPVCTEPQKIVFKPKLLLSLNTNNNDCSTKANLDKEESSPNKRRRV